VKNKRRFHILNLKIGKQEEHINYLVKILKRTAEYVIVKQYHELIHTASHNCNKIRNMTIYCPKLNNAGTYKNSLLT
jgi:hypothetical protein